MAQQTTQAVENNFVKGLITESTGLNFPEHATTDTDNCTYTLIGDVTRRLGINKEVNGAALGIPRAGFALSDFMWANAGGDGLTQIAVRQIGNGLYFYRSSSSTISAPLSTQFLSTQIIDLTPYVASGGGLDTTKECQFTTGNGYLFVFHPNCEPIYCTYNAGTITANVIFIKIRDLVGIPEVGVPDNLRSPAITGAHDYNLINQGWVQGAPWSALSTTSVTVGTGAKVFTIPAGLTITPGQTVTVTMTLPDTGAPSLIGAMTGTVTSYSVTTLTLSISTASGSGTFANWTIIPISTGYLNTFASAAGVYPSNADQWWQFKNTSDVFDPATTLGNVTIGSGPAPKGNIILQAFNQQRTIQSGIGGITDIKTVIRPKTGCWFQGRVWYTGVDFAFPNTGSAPYTNFSENIYFSQIATGTSQFGLCYQQNDPTSATLFDLLPTDGGIINIQGCGSIFELFPIQNGLIVRAANGIWFITGSQGIGFTANDYTITKIADIKSISSTSSVNVNGYPYFWNEEGIYAISATQTGGLEVNPITLGTILSFYNEIPVSCKKFAKAAYHPIDYIIQWVYRDTEPGSITDRYSFNKILNYSTANKAFFPYTVDNSVCNINGILYVSYPGGTSTPEPSFKYPSTIPAGLTYADENDEDLIDWSGPITGGVDYTSYFVTGYRLKGQAIKKFQPQYIMMYSRTNGVLNSYKIQGLWDYANNRNSGRWSTQQLVTNGINRSDVIFRRHKIRGHGYALQMKVTSVPGIPFDIIGWAAVDTVNAGT